MKIGLMLPIGQQELLAGPDRWSLFREMVLAAESSGLDSIWCADHLLFRHDETAEPGGTDGIHEAWTILSAVAAITNRVEIGPLVLCVPFRNPALTAKMATTLDEVSGGRLILGLGCGWHEPEFDAFGYEFDHRVGQFAESLEIIVPMLRTGTATFDGRWQRAADARLAPPGPRPNGPPILIAGKRPRMLDLVARHADAWNMAWYGHPDDAHELREQITRLHAALDAIGRPRDSLELTAGIFVATSPADDDRPEETISGSIDEIGEALAGYEALGVSHLIVHLWPRTVEAVVELGTAAAVARDRPGRRSQRSERVERGRPATSPYGREVRSQRPNRRLGRHIGPIPGVRPMAPCVTGPRKTGIGGPGMPIRAWNWLEVRSQRIPTPQAARPPLVRSRPPELPARPAPGRSVARPGQPGAAQQPCTAQPLRGFPTSRPRSNLRSVPWINRSMLSACASQISAAPTAE